MTLAQSNWCIKVEEKIYGPYTDKQMETFAGAGRLGPTSIVSPAGTQKWCEANQHESLARLFSAEPKANARQFGKSGHESTLRPEGSLAMIIIVFDNVDGTAGRLEADIRTLGDAFRLTGNVWCVATTHSAVGVKNALLPRLTSREPMFVADTHRGRTTWHNMTPQMHARLTRAWVKTAV